MKLEELTSFIDDLEILYQIRCNLITIYDKVEDYEKYRLASEMINRLESQLWNETRR